MRRTILIAGAMLVATCGAAAAKTLTIPVNLIDENGVGKSVGKVGFTDTAKGLRIAPNLTGLPPGPHGMHVHEKADCGPGDQNGKKAAGFAAGGHFDPDKTGKHLGPTAMGGHKGDLPALVVNAKGGARAVMLAPHLKLADLMGHALMIHAGGDNFSDQPQPLGGGGARIACGVVK